ncbi:MAG: hypothetical protein M1820_002008 [Bogoriella megaspora]|nr:MAG: hypothetical protein M1820_002008 [Bogoriella megaspora]
MSSPVSAGDIIKALEICHWIHQNCFDPINNASVVYVAFRDDVLQLELRIKQFQESFENASQQIGRMDLTRFDMLKRESDELVGDYLTTLNECKKLLKKHAKFNGERATVLDNGFWYARTQPRVEALRKDIQSHSHKIQLFLEPIRLELVSDISADTQEILALLRHMRHQSEVTASRRFPEIPCSWDAALTKALARDCPVAFDGAPNVPLRESIDALFLHYQDCNVESANVGICPDTKQNLSLLKAHWLYQIIESSASFSQSRQGSLYRRVLEQLGQRIEQQFELSKIQTWNEEDFESLDDLGWAIWPIKEPPKPEVLTDSHDGEEKLAEVPLICPYPDQKENLHIFRVNEGTLRIVRSRHSKIQSIGPQMTERFLDLYCDRLVPFYAVAPPIGDCYTLNMINGSGGSSVSYDFPTRNAALRIQATFTGYQVLSLATGVTCTMTWRGTSLISRSEQEKSYGEVQIWQWPISKPQSEQFLTKPSLGEQSNSAQSGSRRSISAQQPFHAFDPNIVSITGTREVGEMMIAELPPPPALVFLTRRDSKYIMWHLELSQVSLRDNTRHNKGYRSTFERPSGKAFTLRRLAVHEPQLDFWNIRAITVPTRPTFKDKSTSKDKRKPTVEQLEGTSVVLDFTNAQEQIDFEGYFKHTAIQRMKQVDQYNLGRHVALSQSDTPARRPGYNSPTLQ